MKIGPRKKISALILNTWEIFMQGRMHQWSLILNHWDERIISLCYLILLQAEKFNYLILVKFSLRFNWKIHITDKTSNYFRSFTHYDILFY